MDTMMTIGADFVRNAPLTGDHTPIGLYTALLVTAVAAVICLLLLKNKNKK